MSSAKFEPGEGTHSTGGQNPLTGFLTEHSRDPLVRNHSLPQGERVDLKQ